MLAHFQSCPCIFCPAIKATLTSWDSRLVSPTLFPWPCIDKLSIATSTCTSCRIREYLDTSAGENRVCRASWQMHGSWSQSQCVLASRDPVCWGGGGQVPWGGAPVEGMGEVWSWVALPQASGILPATSPLPPDHSKAEHLQTLEVWRAWPRGQRLSWVCHWGRSPFRPSPQDSAVREARRRSCRGFTQPYLCVLLQEASTFPPPLRLSPNRTYVFHFCKRPDLRKMCFQGTR